MHAVKKACKATDKEILQNIADWRGGSTAVAAILINGVKLIVINVGDSRAISCKNGVAKQLTVDHEPEKEKEKDMVERRGGFVSKRPGIVITSTFCYIEFFYYVDYKFLVRFY